MNDRLIVVLERIAAALEASNSLLTRSIENNVRFSEQSYGLNRAIYEMYANRELHTIEENLDGDPVCVQMAGSELRDFAYSHGAACGLYEELAMEAKIATRDIIRRERREREAAANKTAEEKDND